MAAEHPAATVDVTGALAEVQRARRRARGAADAIQGIPIYLSVWTTLFDIERSLRDAERKLGGDRLIEQAKEREDEHGPSRMVPDGRGGTRPARGPHDYGETPL